MNATCTWKYDLVDIEYAMCTGPYNHYFTFLIDVWAFHRQCPCFIDHKQGVAIR